VVVWWRVDVACCGGHGDSAVCISLCVSVCCFFFCAHKDKGEDQQEYEVLDGEVMLLPLYLKR